MEGQCSSNNIPKNRKQAKANLILSIECSSPSKVCLFLSSHIFHIRYNSTTFETLFLNEVGFLDQHWSKTITNLGITHLRPQTTKTISVMIITIYNHHPSNNFFFFFKLRITNPIVQDIIIARKDLSNPCKPIFLLSCHVLIITNKSLK